MFKDMTKLNKRRFIIYAIIFVIFLLIAGGGIGLHFSGYGDSGKIMKIVSPYIKAYNNLKNVTDVNNATNKSMKAEIIKDGIEVNYKEDEKTYTQKFTYKQESNQYAYLEAIYNRNENAPEEIVKNMIEAVSVVKGNKDGIIFGNSYETARYEYSYFYNTRITDGIRLESTGPNIIVKINLDVNVVKKLGGSEGDIENEIQIIYDDRYKFEDFVAFTMPDKFTKESSMYQASTENNTCLVSLYVISTQTASNSAEFINKLATSKSAEPTTEVVNGSTWNKVTYTGSQGGQNSYYAIDAGESILGFEYQSLFENDECLDLQSALVRTLKLK